MKLATKLLSGAALVVALMNSANASLIDWTFSGVKVEYDKATQFTTNSSLTFTYDTTTHSFSNALFSNDRNFNVTNTAVTLTQPTVNNIIGALFFTYTDGVFNLAPSAEAVIDYSVGGQTISAIFSTNNYTFNIGSGNLTSVARADSTSATAVPEPEAYAMMLAGLGLVGFAARRKKAV